MSHQTFKMSLGFIAVVALLLVASGSASADVTIDGSGHGASYPISSGAHTNVDIRNNNSVLSGTLNQSGTATVTGSMQLAYGDWCGTGETDIYNISAGTFTGKADIGSNGTMNSATGVVCTLNIYGTGSVTVNDQDMHLGGLGPNVTATINVSGSGVLNNSSGNMRWQNDGYINVIGGNASVDLHNVYFGGGEKIGGMSFTLNNSNPSKFISAIVDTANDYNFDLSHTGVGGDSGKILIVAPWGLVSVGQTFDLLMISVGKSILLPAPVDSKYNSLLNGSDAGLFDLTYATNVNVGGTNYNILRATALTPEPATMALLAIGGLGLLIRRRRK